MTVLAGVGPDQAWAWWLALGMVATVNPCGFAMLPAYLSYFLGLEDSDAEVPAPSGLGVVRCDGNLDVSHGLAQRRDLRGS